MKCPKCNREISDKATTCPHCHKVLVLECPNCHTIGENPICENCGYIILTKCSKCGRINSTSKEKCKCGFPVKTSVAYQNCETDEFTSVTIHFEALKQIRKILGSQELFSKFFFRLRNLLIAQFSGVEGKIITYNDTFVVNFNKELSLTTSAHKAIRFALKIANALTDLNSKIIEELGIPLKIKITLIKKQATDLLENISIDNNVKLLTVKNETKKYLKGMQIILDQYVWDEINKDFKTDSLYTIEENGKTLMFYEVLLDTYVLPPNENNVAETPVEIQKLELVSQEEEKAINEIEFTDFKISAKCNFEKTNASKFFENFKQNKIISIRTSENLGVRTSDIVNLYLANEMRVLNVVCTEELNYKPWGMFLQIFQEYYNLSIVNTFLPDDLDLKRFNTILDLLNNKPRQAASPEDARFGYMDDFCAFLASLKNCVILIEGFENIDDTSIQTLELYFETFKNINVSFVFTTNSDLSLHSKIKGLLRTTNYTEYLLQKSAESVILSNIKEEASDFINSFYFEKIKEYYNGSYLYFDNAIRFLKEKNILISFENRLLIKSQKSVMLPNTFEALIKARLKMLSKNMDASMILAFSTYLGNRMDFAVLQALGIKDLNNAVKVLIEKGFAYCKNNTLYINNYNIIKPIIESSIKPQVNEFLCKNILGNIAKGLDSITTIFILGKLSIFKEEYLLLWKNSQFAMSVGDYDAYLKNCLGFLTLLEHISDNISQEDIENNKKEVYQNILMCLYNYSPTKIYSIEKLLLNDAIELNDNDKIIKLSNLMLQGTLISANYTDSLMLLHNILSRMDKPTLIVDGVINTKFLLLSLIHIEILFNIGEYAQCVEVAKDILSVLKPSLLEKIKPINFSTNLFVGHLMETFRLVAFSKLFIMDDGLDEFFELIKNAIGENLPEQECIIAIKDFIAGKAYQVENIEEATPFAKIIYLILQELENNLSDSKKFAQNIYQAKLLSTDIHQKQLEMFCELLIAYSYANINLTKKAEKIYNDLLQNAENSALFGIDILAKFFIAKLHIQNSRYDAAILLINDTLALLQKHNNQFKIMYVLFEKLFIEIAKITELNNIDTRTEEQKLAIENSDGKFARLL